MNTYVDKSNRINRRMESSPIQRKLQKVSRDAIEDENFGEKLRTPITRKVRRARSSGVSSLRGSRTREKEEISPLQRKLQRNSSVGSGSRSSGNGSGGSGNGSSRDTKATVESVLQLLELLQQSPHAIKPNDTDVMERRKPPQRTYSEEIFTPSRRHKRTGVRVPLRMMPKVKPSSMGDLYNKNEESNRKSSRKKKDMKPRDDSESPPSVHKRRAKKGEHRFQTDDFQSDSLPRSPRSRANQNVPSRWRPDDFDDTENLFQDTYKTPKPSNKRDIKDRTEINTIEDFIDHGRSPSKYGTPKNPADNSIDTSYFQEASECSAFGDFHLDRSQRRKSPSKYHNSPREVDEKKSSSHRRDRLSTNGVVLHSTSTTSESTLAEEDKARRRRRKCSAGGKVRNHRTQEEYIGFFLTSPNEDNLKHGYGITKFADGRLFEGVYERGIMVEGKMTYPATGSGPSPTYVGKFDEDGLRCGKGIYTTANTTFLGQFRLDQQHGSGILIYHDGSDGNDTSQSRRFIGHWKDGRKHGYGREILADGTIAQEGLWEAGHFLCSSSRRRA